MEREEKKRWAEEEERNLEEESIEGCEMERRNHWGSLSWRVLAVLRHNAPKNWASEVQNGGWINTLVLERMGIFMNESDLRCLAEGEGEMQDTCRYEIISAL